MVKPLSGGYVSTMVTASVELTPTGDQKQEIKLVKVFLLMYALPPVTCSQQYR